MQSPSVPLDTIVSTNASQLIKLLESFAAEKSLSKKKDDKIAELEERILSLGPKKSEQLISTENRNQQRRRRSM